jgi:hypothetical protein
VIDIEEIKSSFVQVESLEEAQELANNGMTQVMITNVEGRTVRIFAASELFVDEEDRLNKAIEFSRWFTATFKPDTSSVSPTPGQEA